ncbi:hypothetical protein BGZ60DRAFT_428853 [Tricladium varicosporioides]|nr:hypothetical protein BGZ60DRAFT_428853 [Hymenoscyphus varicosporioides]
MCLLLLYLVSFPAIFASTSVDRRSSSPFIPLSQHDTSQQSLIQTCPNTRLIFSPSQVSEFGNHSVCNTSWNENSVLQGYKATDSAPESVNIHHPWKSEPECLQNEEQLKEYCIYTSSNFRNGRGISLLTTSFTAVTISFSSGFSLHPQIYPTPTSNTYYETSLPGRGKGLISNGTFQRGDLIQSSTPVLIIDEETFDILEDEERFAFQRKAIDALPVATRDLFYGLAGHFGIDKVEDIIRTNTFGAHFEGRMHGVVVPEAARLNHDCRPNARFAFDPETLTHKVHAIRTIKPGEELTISYIDEKVPSSTRHSHIHSHWGFACTCATCSLPSSSLALSDARLHDITYLRTGLLDFSPTSTATPAMAESFIKLIETEQLWNSIAEAYMLASLRYCMWEEEGKTREYARRAVESWLVWEKKGVQNRESLEIIGRMPRGGWCWGLARLQEVGNREL